MALSLSQAAKAAGKSKSTINRAIKCGKLSATRHEDGSYSIDASELSRAFQIGTPMGSKWISVEPAGTAVLEAENAALRAALDREREITNDLMIDRDAWKQQATALLLSPPKSRRWWVRGKN